MKIPFYPYNQVFSSDKKNYLQIFQDVCSKGSFIMQSELENFEKNMLNILIVSSQLVSEMPLMPWN